MNKQDFQRILRKKTRSRVCAFGSAVRPRLVARRTLRGMYGQLIDDVTSTTIVAADWREVDEKKFPKNTVERAHAVGKLLAEKAVKKGVKKAVFDRGGRAYHGKVRSLAEGAREGGLQF